MSSDLYFNIASRLGLMVRWGVCVCMCACVWGVGGGGDLEGEGPRFHD